MNSAGRRERTSQRCIVTGASTGIGRAIKSKLQRAGFRVIGMQRSHAEVAVDLSDASQIPGAWNAAVSRLGGLPELVVLNAGASTNEPFVDESLTSMSRLLNLNLLATLLLAREAIRCWTSHKSSGHLVFIGSQAALPGARQTDNVVYTASKGGIHAVIGPLANEYGPRIRVNCVAPGDVSTEAELKQLARLADRSRETSGAMIEKVASMAALRRWVKPEEVAEAVLLLHKCEAITAAILNVSAGRSSH